MIGFLVELAGYIGMVLVLLTLFLARKHFFESQIVSLIGGGLLTTYAFIIAAFPVMILNTMWTVISVYNLLKSKRERQK